MSLTNLSTQISALVAAHLQDELKHILLDIAKRYSIDAQELIELYQQKSETKSCCVQDQCSTSEKKKRGRKKKQKDEFIETEEYEYDGTKYLVDSNNNVYTFNVEEPHLIGERFVDGTIRFFSE
jgi:hypothetical protein